MALASCSLFWGRAGRGPEVPEHGSVRPSGLSNEVCDVLEIGQAHIQNICREAVGEGVLLRDARQTTYSMGKISKHAYASICPHCATSVQDPLAGRCSPLPSRSSPPRRYQETTLAFLKARKSVYKVLDLPN